MNLSISNIAWDVSEDEDIDVLLKKYGVCRIDIAPGKYFKISKEVKDTEITRVREWWAERGINIVGMQSLMFGTTGMNVFGEPSSQVSMLQHLNEICRIASVLGSSRLVFGSPKNRDCAGTDPDKVLDIALSFFNELGNIAKSHGVTITLEPNPVEYGANFMTSTYDTAEIVMQLSNPSIRMQLDTGAITINKEDIFDILNKYSAIIAHIHISEPYLMPVGDGATDHNIISRSLGAYLPQLTATIEMVATTDEPHLNSIERSLMHATQIYCNHSIG